MNVSLEALTADETEALAAGLLAPADTELSLSAAAFSAEERRRLAKNDEAMPDGSFPIRNVADLRNAVAAFGRAKDPAAARAWIRKRARALGAEDALPKEWLTASADVQEQQDDTMGEDNERYAAQLCPHCGNDVNATPGGAMTASSDGRQVVPMIMLDEQHTFSNTQSTNLAVSWGTEVLTAAAAGMAPEVPPADWFTTPEADRPTPLTITADGQVFGHAALWNTCHTGIPGRCTTPPRSPSGYRFFHLGATETDDGGTVSTGKITFGAGHAPLTASRSGTAAHYDNTAHAGADVVARDGKHGIWVAGALRPGLAARAVKTLRAAALSGDWRSVNGALELIGLLAVNVPGFPVPRTSALVSAATGEYENEEEGGDPWEPVTALVAAGIVLQEDPCEPCADAELDDLLAPVALDALLSEQL